MAALENKGLIAGYCKYLISFKHGQTISRWYQHVVIIFSGTVEQGFDVVLVITKS